VRWVVRAVKGIWNLALQTANALGAVALMIAVLSGAVLFFASVGPVFGWLRILLAVIGLLGVIFGGAVGVALWVDRGTPSPPVATLPAAPVATTTRTDVAPVPTQPPAQAGTTEPGFVDAHVTPDYVLGLYEGRLDIQAQALVRPFIGQKMRVAIRVRNVASAPNGEWASISAELERSGSSLIMFFNEHDELSSIAGLQRGDLITVVGTLDRSDSMSVRLDPCTLERVG
jgi:hypothetical protein